MCNCNHNCQDCPNRDKEELRPSRRKVMGWLVAGINVVVATAIVGPVLGFVGAPLVRKGGGTWVPILGDHELTDGETKEVSFTVPVKDGYTIVKRRYTVFLRRFPDRVAAFDPSCTHLGCRIQYHGDKGRYMCPCHGGVFDDTGHVVSGPPPKPLEQHPVKVEAGKIWLYKEA